MMTPVLFLLLIILLIISLFLAIYYRKKFGDVSDKLANSNYQISKLNDFMKFFSDVISHADKFSKVYSLIAKHISEIIDAKGICIYKLNKDGFLVPAGYTDMFPPLQSSQKYKLSQPLYATDSLKNEKIKVGDGIIGEIAQKEKGVLISNSSQDKRLETANKIYPIYTFMAVPMKMDNELTGVICAANSKQQRYFTKSHYATLESMAKLIVPIHSIIQAYASLSVQQRLSQELEFARLLQMSLLPKEFPKWEPFVIHAFTRSAKEVSGDFYDFVEIDKNRLLVVLGDASGKGIPACMVMAMTRSFIRANIGRFTTLADMLVELNKNLFRDTDEGRFSTIGCCVLDRKEQTVEFGRAGHTELLCYSSKGSIREITPNGKALGLLPEDVAGYYDTFLFTFKSYYSMILYSDGITEITNSQGEEYGVNRLKSAFYQSCKLEYPPRKCTDRILHSLDNFSEGVERKDDQTMVIISHKDTYA